MQASIPRRSTIWPASAPEKKTMENDMKIEGPHISATEFLASIGEFAPLKRGSNEILKALNRLGIKPSDTRPYARGVMFFVSSADADRVRRSMQSSSRISRTSAVTERTELSEKARRDIRTVARALLDLYDRLGESPHEISEICALAEKDAR